MKGQRRGQVLEVLKELLAEGRLDEVLALVSKLVARNSELERRLAEMLLDGLSGHLLSTSPRQMSTCGPLPEEA